MKLFDSNILIYSYKPGYGFLKSLIIDSNNAISSITMLKVLGYSQIQQGEKSHIENILKLLIQIPIDDFVLDEAIRLRQLYGLKLADSIIGATALLNNAELNTRNINDFKNIPGLILVNPIP
jgi:toxin FitB